MNFGIEGLRRRLEEGWNAARRSAAEGARGAKVGAESRTAGVKRAGAAIEEEVLAEAGAYADRVRQGAEDTAAAADSFLRQAAPPVAHELKQVPRTMGQIAGTFGHRSLRRAAAHLEGAAPNDERLTRPPVPPPPAKGPLRSAAARAGDGAGRAMAGLLHGLAQVTAFEVIAGVVPYDVAEGIVRVAHEAYHGAGGGVAGLKAIDERIDPVTLGRHAFEALHRAIEKGDPYEAALAAVVIAALADIVAKYGIEAPPPPASEAEALAATSARRALSAKALQDLTKATKRR